MRRRAGKRGGNAGGIKSRMQRNRAERKKRANTRQENKFKRKDRRIAAKDLRKNAKISKKTAKKLSKIYGEMTPEEVNQLNEIQPHIGAMADELESRGIPVEDEGDPLEIATKYAQANEEIPDPLDDEEYAQAFSDDEESFESVDKFNKRKQVVKSVLTGIVSGVNEFAKGAEQKERYGLPLSPQEKAILEGKRDFTDAGTKEWLSDNFGKIVLLLAVVIVFLVATKKS